MNLSELKKRLVKWRAQRGIEENSTAEAQHNCYLEERREMMDAIGDQVVCLVNEMAMPDVSGPNYICAKGIISYLEDLCAHQGIDFDECLQMAWDEIEHRVGLVRSTGKFTKWKDLTHEERLIVAKSGQLINAPRKIVDDCQSLCTPMEWSEIQAAEESSFNA